MIFANKINEKSNSFLSYIFLSLQKDEQDRIRRQQLEQLEKEKIRQQQEADYDYYYADEGCEVGELRSTKVHTPTRCSKVSKVNFFVTVKYKR